ADICYEDDEVRVPVSVAVDADVVLKHGKVRRGLEGVDGEHQRCVGSSRVHEGLHADRPDACGTCLLVLPCETPRVEVRRTGYSLRAVLECHGARRMRGVQRAGELRLDLRACT